MGAFAISAALFQWLRTDQGQYIDLAMLHLGRFPHHRAAPPVHESDRISVQGPGAPAHGRNMFVEFMEDDLGIRLRDTIGVDNMLWGSDFPHAKSTWPKSRDFLDRIFAGVPEADVEKITAGNAAACLGLFDMGAPTRPPSPRSGSARPGEAGAHLEIGATRRVG